MMNGERTATSMNIEQRLPTVRRDQRGAARRLTSGDCGVDADGRPEEKSPSVRLSTVRRRQRPFVSFLVPALCIPPGLVRS
jgi:hypothetical protein